MSPLAQALLAELGPDDLAALAQRLAPYLPAVEQDDRWLGTSDAAAYLGLSVKALHHRTAADDVPCHRDSPDRGAKCWFLKSELDAWRRGELK
jgi:hypothetical protein